MRAFGGKYRPGDVDVRNDVPGHGEPRPDRPEHPERPPARWAHLQRRARGGGEPVALALPATPEASRGELGATLVPRLEQKPAPGYQPHHVRRDQEYRSRGE